MKQKKFIYLLLAFVIVFTAQIRVCAVDSTSALLTVEESELTQGNSIIEIRLESNEKILGGSFDLVYDPSVLQYRYVNSHGFNLQVNDRYAQNKIRVSFASTNGMTSGVLLEFCFTPIVSESCTTALSFDEVSLYNGEGRNVDTVSAGAVCDVKIKKPLESFELNTESLCLGVGDEAQMSCVITPADADIERIKWITHTPSVATVDQNGKITAVRVGSTYMDCIVVDGSHYRYTKTFHVVVYQKPNVTVSGGYLSEGEQITVSVRLDTLRSVYTSGSLNMTYDPELLSIDSAEVGNMLNGCMATVNPAYRDDAVRLNFLGQQGVSGSGEICKLTFTALADGVAEIEIEDELFYTDGGLEHCANLGKGEITVGDYSVSVNAPSEAKGWREFKADVSFSATPGVAGGSLVITYDADQLRYLGYSDTMNGFTVTVNDSYTEGKIRISFAGTRGVGEGSLISLRFVSLENPENGIPTEIGIDGTPMLYTDNAVKIVPSASNASFTVAHSEEPRDNGDCDYNGETDTRDATSLLKYILGADEAILVDSFADLNGDGVVNDGDMDHMMKLLAGWDMTIL